MKTEKSKAKKRLVSTMRAAAAITGWPLWLLQTARDCGCSAFRSNGRVSIGELQNFVMNDWHPMPDSVFEYLHREWESKIKPTLPENLGVANGYAEAAKRTGLYVSMIRFIQDSGESKAFLDE